MKRMLSVLLALCIIIGVVPVFATAEVVASGTCGKNVTWKLGDGTLTISGTGRMEDYDPFGAPWGYGYGNPIQTVVIEQGVTSIGSYVFCGCENLTSMTIPNSVTNIEQGAFGGCLRLPSITIPDSVTSIGDDAFVDCWNLTSITIPNSVTSIGDSAFWKCTSLTSITIPASVTSIGDYAFALCESLKAITVVSSNAVYADIEGILFTKDMKTLVAYPGGNTATQYIIPASVTSIGGYAFSVSRSLTSITIPAGVTSIGGSAFWACSSLTSITIPASVTSIGNSTFWCCYSLTTINIPNSVTRIGDNAFFECSSLTSITIPASVTSIRNSAFWNCSSLKDVYYGSTEAQWSEIDIDEGSNNPLQNANIHYNSPGPDQPVTPSGEFKISANTATTCLKSGTTFEMDVAYYRDGTIDLSSQRFIAVSSNSNILDFTTGAWNDKTGLRYTVKAKQAGSCSITFTNPSDGAASKIDFTVIDGETGYTFAGVPKMTVEEGKTTNFYNFSGLVVDDFAYTPHTGAGGNIDYYNVTMTVYNSKNLYGTVTSYTEDGEIYEVSVIDKHSDYATSFVSDLKELKNSIGDLFYLLGNDKYYSGESISTRTPVSLRVPAGGYLQISNSLSSETAVFANVIGLLVEGTLRTKELVNSSDKLFDASGEIVDMVLQDNMEKLGMILTDNFVEKQVSKELKNTVQKSFKIGTWNLDNYGDFIRSFLDNLTELGVDLAESVSKTLNDGWGVLSVTESVVKKVIPTGHLINFLYSTLGVADEALFWLNFQASANFPSGIFIYAPASGNSYQSNGVSVTPAGQTDSNVVVHAYLVMDTGDTSGGKRETYSINMYRDGEKIQPDTTITVRIPLSEQFDGLDKSIIKVFRQNDDGSMTNMNATIVDGYAVFKTNHLSYYSIIAKSDWVNPFTDVKPDAYYADAVAWAVKGSITNGTGVGKFSPNGACTRGQIVTFLWRSAGKPEPKSTNNPFKDVKSGDYFYKAVLWAVENGITNGTGKDTFRPNATCTRGDAVTFMWRAAKKPNVQKTSRFKDVVSGSYYERAVNWAVANGVTNGISANSFGPKNKCTRAQIVTFLYRWKTT